MGIRKDRLRRIFGIKEEENRIGFLGLFLDFCFRIDLEEGESELSVRLNFCLLDIIVIVVCIFRYLLLL